MSTSPTGTGLRLDGRVVLVTGAARGQGRAIAERVVQAGAAVIAGDVLGSVDELAAMHPEQILSGRLDVTDPASWQSLIDQGIERFGRLDGLVNNAGILRRASFETEEATELERVWRVNCLGPFLGMQAALTHLRASGNGAIVNTISTAAIEAPTLHGAYASSKWALRGLTKVVALELAPQGVRVNAIMPGPILTPMVVPDDDPLAAARFAGTPIGRAGLPTDIAELVLFLLSDASAYMTGSEIAIDGGQTAGIVLRDRSR